MSSSAILRFILKLWPGLLSGSIAGLCTWFLWRRIRPKPSTSDVPNDMPVTKAGQISALNMAVRSSAHMYEAMINGHWF